jgi:hypothetical protein
LMKCQVRPTARGPRLATLLLLAVVLLVIVSAPF